MRTSALQQAQSRAAVSVTRLPPDLLPQLNREVRVSNRDLWDVQIYTLQFIDALTSLTFSLFSSICCSLALYNPTLFLIFSNKSVRVSQNKWIHNDIRLYERGLYLPCLLSSEQNRFHWIFLIHSLAHESIHFLYFMFLGVFVLYDQNRTQTHQSSHLIPGGKSSSCCCFSLSSHKWISNLHYTNS